MEPKLTEFWKKNLEDWSIDVEALNFKSRLHNLPDLKNRELRPDLNAAFTLEIELIRGKLAGQFTTERKELVNLFMDGTYTLRGPNYNVTVFSNQTIVYHSSGHEITEWPNGNVNWKLPNGKVLSFSKE